MIKSFYCRFTKKACALFWFYADEIYSYNQIITNNTSMLPMKSHLRSHKQFALHMFSRCC